MLSAWSLLAYAGTVAMAVALTGAFARHRYRVWIFFPLFLAVSLVCTVLLLFSMALELAYRTFRAFPGALATLRWVLLLVLVTTLFAVIAVSGGGSDFQ